MAITLGIELNEKNIPNTLKIDGILTYLEFASNIIMLCDKEVFQEGSKTKFYREYQILHNNINMTLENLNFCKKEFEKEEKVILFEKNPSAIAVAEIVDEDTAYKVIEYNHYLLKGNIDKKKRYFIAIS